MASSSVYLLIDHPWQAEMSASHDCSKPDRSDCRPEAYLEYKRLVLS